MVIVNQFSRLHDLLRCRIDAVPQLGADLLTVRIPDCAMFDFRNARLDVLSGGTGAALRRDGVGTYTFPDGIGASGADPLELGRTLTLQIDPKGADLTLIGYDWESADYRVIRYR